MFPGKTVRECHVEAFRSLKTKHLEERYSFKNLILMKQQQDLHYKWFSVMFSLY